jgi:hypothetical protein
LERGEESKQEASERKLRDYSIFLGRLAVQSSDRGAEREREGFLRVSNRESIT